MKMKVLLAMVVGMGSLLLGTGCVDTVSGGKTAGVPLIRDTFTARYQRPMDQVFNASKQVVKDMGILLNEGILYGQTNSVRTLQGKINQRTVWVRAEALEPQLTEVSVQARTSGGASDVDLLHEIDKQIAVKLATR